MNRRTFVAALLALISSALAGPPSAETGESIRWLGEFDGQSVPSSPAWTPRGTPEAAVTEGGLRLADSSKARPQSPGPAPAV